MTYNNTSSNHMIFYTQPSHVTFTASPSHIIFNNPIPSPNHMIFYTQPNYMTFNASPNHIIFHTQPNHMTFTASPNHIIGRLDRVLRSAARLIGHIPKYASVSAYMRMFCAGFLSPNAFCIGSQYLSGDL